MRCAASLGFAHCKKVGEQCHPDNKPVPSKLSANANSAVIRIHVLELVCKRVKGSQCWGLVLADENGRGFAEVVLKTSPALNDSIIKFEAAAKSGDFTRDVH